MKLFSLLSSALLLSDIAVVAKKSSPKKASKTARKTASATGGDSPSGGRSESPTGGRSDQFKSSSSRKKSKAGPRVPADYWKTTKSTTTKKGPSKRPPKKSPKPSPPPKLHTHAPTPAPANWDNFDTDLVVLCADGTVEELSVVYLPANFPGFQYQWNWNTICAAHGGYITCPLSAPNVCQDKECGFDGKQLCCAAYVPLCGIPEGFWIGGNGQDTEPDTELTLTEQTTRTGHSYQDEQALRQPQQATAGDSLQVIQYEFVDCDNDNGVPCDSFIYKANIGTGRPNNFGQGTGPDGGYGRSDGDEVPAPVDKERLGLFGPQVLPATSRTYTTPSYTDTPAVEVTCDELSWFRGFGGGGRGGDANHCGIREVEYCTGAKCFGNPGERVSFEYECVVKTREGRNIDPLDKPTGAPSPAPVPVTAAPSATPDTAAPTPTEDNPDYDPRLQVCSAPVQIGNSLVCYFVDDISDYSPEPLEIQDNVFVSIPTQLGVNWKRETCLFDVKTVRDDELNQYACSCTERKCMIPEKVPYDKDICPNSWREGADCWYNGCQDPSNKRSVDEPPQDYAPQCSDWCGIFSQADITDYADYGNTGECPYATFSDGSQCYGANAAFNVPQGDEQNAPVPEICVLEIPPEPPLAFDYNVTVGFESFNWFLDPTSFPLVPGDRRVTEGISFGVQVFKTDAFGSDSFFIRDAADNDQFSCDNPWDTTGPAILPVDCSCYTWSNRVSSRALPLADFNVTKKSYEAEGDYWWSSPVYPFLEVRGGCAAVGKSVQPNDAYCSSLPGGVCTVEACCFDSGSAFDQWEKKEDAIAEQHNFTNPNTCYHNNFYNFPLQYQYAITPPGFTDQGGGNVFLTAGNPENGGGCNELGFAPSSEDMARSCKGSRGAVCSICSCCTTTKEEYDKCAEDSNGLYLTPGDEMDTFNWETTSAIELQRYLDEEAAEAAEAAAAETR